MFEYITTCTYPISFFVYSYIEKDKKITETRYESI